MFYFRSTPSIFMNNHVDMIQGVEETKINHNFCMKSQILGYELCISLRRPDAFQDSHSPYFPLSGKAHFGMKLNPLKIN